MADFYNSLLKRREVKAILNSLGNPSTAEGLKFIADNFKVREELVSIKKIENNYGSREFMVHAFVYDSVDDKLKSEPKAKEVKKTS